MDVLPHVWTFRSMGDLPHGRGAKRYSRFAPKMVYI